MRTNKQSGSSRTIEPSVHFYIKKIRRIHTYTCKGNVSESIFWHSILFTISTNVDLSPLVSRWRQSSGTPWFHVLKSASQVVSTQQSSVSDAMATHPFGCETETSLQDLFEYFKRCLQHGEWELACACVPQLLSSSGGLSANLRGIIKAIICHPYSLAWVAQLPWNVDFLIHVLENVVN